MLARIDRHWTQEVPAAWETALRAISPVSAVVPWLALRWFPRVHTVNGALTDCGRWTLYECVHESLIPENERDIIRMLAGPKPSTLPLRERMGRLLFVDDWCCEMYQQHRVWPRPAWILQGDAGGHAVVYQDAEQQLLQAKGLPTSPPNLGDLPYVGFDARAIAQLRRRNRLIQLGNDLDALKRSGTAASMEAEWKASQRAFRTEYVQYLEEQMAPCADFMDWYTSSASTSTEARNTIPAMSQAEQRAAITAKDQYIETGMLPAA